MHIIVNGKREEIDVNLPHQEVSYAMVVKLAYPNASHLWTPTVTYRHPSGHGGEMTPGNTKVVADGMIFNVVDTSNA